MDCPALFPPMISPQRGFSPGHALLKLLGGKIFLVGVPVTGFIDFHQMPNVSMVVLRECRENIGRILDTNGMIISMIMIRG